MLSLDNICPHRRVAQGLLKIYSLDTTVFIGFYKYQFWRKPTSFLSLRKM